MEARLCLKPRREMIDRRKMGMRLGVRAILVGCATLSFANAQSAIEAEFKAGIEAKAQGNYTLAIDHFKRAAALDPAMIAVHLELADTADAWCGAEYLTSSEVTPDFCDLAAKEYRKILSVDASNARASKGIAYALYSQYRLDEAEALYRVALSSTADDTEVLCGLTKIDSEKAWQAEALAKVNAGLSIKESLIGSPACADAGAQNLSRIDEGISFATTLTRRYPADANLAGFLGVLYRERADIQCGDKHAFSVDKKTSAEWYRTGTRTVRRTANRLHDVPSLRCPPAPPSPR
jgi:tetratricopeptide (TPR) repeat protein